MNEDSSVPRPERSLDRYGAASRCLLRLWENQGNPSPSDDAFLRRFAAQFPEWDDRPGELAPDAAVLSVVGSELGLASEIRSTRDYDSVLAAHRAELGVIIATDQPPLQQSPVRVPRQHFMVLEQMDEDGFVVWCPFESGASDLLPRADRQWWSRWNATAFIFGA